MKKMLVLKIDKDEALSDILLADSFFKRLSGYMFQKKPMSKGILFRNCNSLHSYFMHFDIDLYFLDQESHLLRVERGFSKNKTLYVKEATHVLETISGAVDIRSIKIGQAFDFVSTASKPN